MMLMIMMRIITKKIIIMKEKGIIEEGRETYEGKRENHTRREKNSKLWDYPENSSIVVALTEELENITAGLVQPASSMVAEDGDAVLNQLQPFSELFSFGLSSEQ